ncbi:DNA polymerase III subunit gamma and tau [Streptacidiphilus carbonis]|uniref:DNA polymerase III subunit gamma and tau n=1 Tax=Streptacidiphilus carbonis TaxID=105422 RepID=UPI0005A977FF|nr:DNA polymerase III subunit gamma and tau [Streptacidiphilus carbonis]
MSLALYRRYRPETFAEVIGQEHVTGPLQQALRNNRVNHAYLFSGPRGCGKTTSARILARCLNCEQGPTPTPCGVCQSCTDLARGGPGSIDVIEIDAASHGGVDDTRDLREKAFFAPASSRYKIYIIDEAHMVSTAGFNALLKVVEEPPEHLKFIFATTEPEKVIGTIRSRTHHYPFRLVPPGTLRDYLAEVCGREEIRVEDTVYPLVVRAGAGSVRDSMSVMDQLLAGAADEGVTYAMATALLGYTDAGLLDEVVDAFAAQDGATVFGIVDRVIEGGHDPRRFVADLLERLRDLVILSAVPDAGEKGIIDAPADRIALMEQQAAKFGPAELSRAADIVNTGLTEMRGATSPRLQLELICARVMLPGAYDDERSTQARLDRLERRGAFTGGGHEVAAPPVMASAPVPVLEAAPVRHQPASPAPEAERPSAPHASSVQQTQQVRQAQPTQQAPEGATAQSSPAAGQGGAPRGAWPVPRSFPAPGGAGAPAPESAAAPAPRAAPQAAPQPAGQPAAPPVQQSAPPQQSGQAQQPTGQQQGGAGQVRQMWPQILDAVKGRRRVTWMLVQQAQVAGFDGSTLQLSFEHAGTRDGFVNGGHDDILRQAIQDSFGMSWRIDCIIDPSVGRGPGPGSPSSAQAPAQAQGQQQYQAPVQPPQQAAPQQPAPQQQYQAPPAQQFNPPPAQHSVPSVQPPAPAPGPQAGPAPQPAPPVSDPHPLSPDDETIPEDEAGCGHGMVSGPELIMRELGATVIQEIEHDR